MYTCYYYFPKRDFSKNANSKTVTLKYWVSFRDLHVTITYLLGLNSPKNIILFFIIIFFYMTHRDINIYFTLV